MATEEQINANRANAEKSTGPTSIDGKAKSSQNSLKHGLLSSKMLLPDESIEEFESFAHSLIASLKPESVIESMLAEKVVASAWRMRRLLRIEGGLLSGKTNTDDIFSGAGTAEATFFIKRSESAMVLSKYETSIERSLYRALDEIKRLQLGVSEI